MRERTTKTKSSIENAVLNPSLKKALDEITVNEICEVCSISRTTFYRYFDSIYEVLDELGDRHINGFLKIQTEFFCKESMDDFQYVESLLKFIKSEQLFFKSVLGNNSNRPFLHRWKAIIKDDLKKKYLRESTTEYVNDLTLEMIVSACIGAYSYWLFHEEISVRDVSENVLRQWNLNISR